MGKYCEDCGKKSDNIKYPICKKCYAIKHSTKETEKTSKRRKKTENVEVVNKEEKDFSFDLGEKVSLSYLAIIVIFILGLVVGACFI